MSGKGDGKAFTGGAGNGPLPGKLYNPTQPTIKSGGGKVGGKGTVLKLNTTSD